LIQCLSMNRKNIYAAFSLLGYRIFHGGHIRGQWSSKWQKNHVCLQRIEEIVIKKNTILKKQKQIWELRCQGCIWFGCAAALQYSCCGRKCFVSQKIVVIEPWQDSSWEHYVQQKLFWPSYRHHVNPQLLPKPVHKSWGTWGKQQHE